MRYYYFDPKKKQYYFPENYRAYPLFCSFYQPYTVKGWILWNLWHRFGLFRRRFVANGLEQMLTFENLKLYLPVQNVVAFNRGTVGAEQKITVLGIDTNTSEAFFVKYAETAIAQANVKNEGEVLKQLAQLDFVPKLQQLVSTDSFSFIQTSVLKGERIRKQQIDTQVLELLFRLAEQKIETERNYPSGVQHCVAHGDFCPWNMMLDNGKLVVFDWEMAGVYPLGYDLFTYLFQTSFLLRPRKEIASILSENKQLISTYFEHFNVNNWKRSLIEFGELKLQLEKKKQNNTLIYCYKKLVHEAKKL